MKLREEMDNINKIIENPHFKNLQSIVEEKFPDDDEQILYCIDSEMDSMYKENADISEDEKGEVFNYIIPSIAIYNVLKKYSDETTAIGIFKEMFLKAAYKGADSLREKAKEPGFIEGFIKKAFNLKDGNSGGLEKRVVCDTKNKTEFDVIKCPYVIYCNKYNVSELSTVFCECDDIFYGNIHPRLIWSRTKTIARGDEVCDFKFEIIE